MRVSSPRLCIPKNIRVFTFVTSVEHFGRPSSSRRRTKVFELFSSATKMNVRKIVVRDKIKTSSWRRGRFVSLYVRRWCYVDALIYDVSWKMLVFNPYSQNIYNCIIKYDKIVVNVGWKLYLGHFINVFNVPWAHGVAITFEKYLLHLNYVKIEIKHDHLTTSFWRQVFLWYGKNA